jgi:hypothetical protein
MPAASAELFSLFSFRIFKRHPLVTASRAILATFTHHVERLEEHTYSIRLSYDLGTDRTAESVHSTCQAEENGTTPEPLRLD